MSESLQKLLILLAVSAVVIYAFTREIGGGSSSLRESEKTRITAKVEPEVEAVPTPVVVAPTPIPTPTLAPPPRRTPHQVPVAQALPKTSQRPANALQFRMEDGVAVVQGDVVVGTLVGDDGTVESGFVKVPTLALWNSNVIPYFIDPGLRDPERVLKALEFFAGTAIHFVPYEDQEDVMVFQEGTGVCKSYVGRIGGKQPLWISPGCRADDIAHEILHALGFVHEQNRSDRDQYLVLYPENIEEKYQENFVRLPQELMQVTGLSPFDFESLMIYPPSMFSKNGQSTMASRLKDQEIRPGAGLSRRDIERINKAYGGE